MINVDELLKDLTEPQRQAVTHLDGPLLIVAGPGSGKTRVITRRVAYLMSQGVAGRSILAITFTNKAAGEMKTRVGDVLGRPLRDFGQLDQPWPMVCTFHSLCLRILRAYAAMVGLPANFSIYDSADQLKVVKRVMEAMTVHDSSLTPGRVHAMISAAKNRLQSPADYQASDRHDESVAEIFRRYQEMLTANSALDFDDLLLITARGMRDHPRMLEELQDRFRYILIDEYQDTNHAQYMLAHALASRYRNICVVGDPDQSIYGWRGANIQNILDFEKDYRDAKVVKLEQNYRSTKTILRVADELISRNLRRKHKTLWTERQEGEKVRLLCCGDEHEEATSVMQELRRLHEERSIPWSGMAVFYRVNALSRVMEDALRRAGIPYQIARGVEFYGRREVKDVLAYLRAVANPADNVSLERIANVPARGISDKTMDHLRAYADANGLTLLGAMERVSGVSALKPAAMNAVRAFVEKMRGWREMAVCDASAADGPRCVKTVREVMEAVVRQSGLEEMYKQVSAKDREKEKDEMANINELISSAAEFDREHPEGTLVDYLTAVSLVSDADHISGQSGAVTLMTLHAAKGLEFAVVAMIGLEEGLVPHERAMESDAAMEEERRLCFVGLTRAQEHLLLSNARRRMIRGKTDTTRPSHFLNEMPRDAMEIVGGGFSSPAASTYSSGWPRGAVSYRGRPRRALRGGEDFGDAPASAGSHGLRAGQMVRSPRFGIGRVISVSTMGQYTRVQVEFNEGGRKTLAAEHAGLEVVG